MLDKIEIVKPTEIEKRSMEIITSELNGRTWPEPEFSIVKRCIHTSADFDYADNLCFSENAAMLGVEALRRGAVIVTDTPYGMVRDQQEKTGRVWRRGILLYVGCRMWHRKRKSRGCTRAAICMERGAALGKEVIFAVGNAPTALIRLYELIKAGRGKTGADHWCTCRICQCGGSKRADHDSRGSLYCSEEDAKGGSNIAATICNAMLYYKG